MEQSHLVPHHENLFPEVSDLIESERAVLPVLADDLHREGGHHVQDVIIELVRKPVLAGSI